MAEECSQRKPVGAEMWRGGGDGVSVDAGGCENGHLGVWWELRRQGNVGVKSGRWWAVVEI